MLRKFLLIVSIICLFLVILTPIEVLAEENRTIRVAGDNNYPPYEYVDENGIYKGFNVDIMRAIAIELGLDIELVPMTWQDALIALQSREVDAIQGMTKSKIREESFSFSDTLVTNSQSIFVRKDTNYISDIDDLANIPVAFQKGDISYEAIRKSPDIISVIKENQQQAFDALLDGEVEAFIGNRLTGLYYSQKQKKLEQIKIVGEPIYITEYCIASIKGDTETIEILNKGISILKKNGTYDKIYRKWFGETFADKSLYFKRILYIITSILIIALLIIAIIVYVNRALKREVENRTGELQVQREKLDKSNRMRGKILESITSGIIAFNQKGEVIISNSSASQLLDIDIVQGFVWEQLRLEEKIDVSYLQKALEGHLWEEDMTWEKNGDEKAYIHCSLIPIKGPEEIEGAILLLRNHTREKKLQTIANHNEKMQAIGRLSAGIAHELRNPLTSIKAFIDLIPSKIDNLNFREQFIKTIPSEIQRLSNLVSLLLDYARPKSSQPQENILSKVIDEILILFSVQLRKKNIKIIKNYSTEKFWADKQQIKQVLINVILNCVEAIGENGEITINSFYEEKKTVIQISDTGCGIPIEAIDKVFNPFFTLKTQGYGIGLSISHQLVKENVGDIQITSIKDKGTTVIVYLPTVREEEDILDE